MQAKDEFCTKIECSHKTEYEKSGLSVHSDLLQIYVHNILMESPVIFFINQKPKLWDYYILYIRTRKKKIY